MQHINRYIAAIIIILLTSGSPIRSSNSQPDLTLDIPDVKIQLFGGIGQNHNTSANFNNTYGQAPLLGVLYVSKNCADKRGLLRTFYSNYIKRAEFIDPDEQISNECTCLFLTPKPSQDLHRCLEVLGPGPGFLIADDNDSLIKLHQQNLNMSVLMLFMKGKLIYKETIGPDDPIPHF